MYYVWIREELRRIDIESIPLDQGTVTLRVPVANLLTKDLDVLPEVRRANRLANIGHALDVKVEIDRPGMNMGDRAELLSNVQAGLTSRSFDLLDAIAELPTDHWIEPKRGTLAWHLREGNRHIRTGKTEKCKSELALAATLLGSATSIEKADFHYLNGRLQSIEGDNQGARDSYWEAATFEDQPKFWTAWAESELRLRFQLGDKNDFSDILGKLRGDQPSILAIKARLLAAEGKYDESIALLDTFTGVENLSARVIIETMNSKYADAFKACMEGLELPDINDVSRQLFFLMKALARFSLAIEKSGVALVGEILPPSGIPGMDVELLRQAWQDIQEAVELLRDGGWTSNVDFIADIWAIGASMLGKQEETLPLIVAAAKTRPHFETLQGAAETVAAQCAEFEIALEINDRTPDSDTKWLRRTAYLHELHRHKACVDLFEKHVGHVDRRHQLFGIVLPMGILSARKIAKTDLARQWTAIMESDSKLAPQKAVGNYLAAVDANKLAKADALRALQEQYQALDRPKPIAFLLFMELDPADEAQAPICVEVARDIRATTILPRGGAVHLAMCFVTTKRWQELRDLCQEAGNQFEGTTRLMAFEGLALDRLGRTDEARKILERMINGGVSDSVALNTYVNILVRGGFVDEAITTAERIFELATSDAQKMECIRLLFNLEQTSNPASPRLVELAEHMGQLADPAVEEQEVVYLMMMITGTSSGGATPTREQIEPFQIRLNAFSMNFPHSKILMKAQVSNDATAEELLQAIHEIAGLDDESRAFHAKLENQLQAGTMPIHYAWRPKRVLRNVHDVVHLWEVTKRSGADDRKHHLIMMVMGWSPRPAASTRALIPLLDLTSLLVISDLGLFDHLFSYFQKIAISKGTLLKLSKLTHPFSGSPWLTQCKDLQDRLKERYAQILQPSAEPSDDDDRRLGAASEEIKRLCKTGTFTLYSDDAIFRLYCGGDDPSAQGICTGDLLSGLEQIGAMTALEVAQKLATLCSWHVGIVIDFKHQMAIIPDEARKIGSVAKGGDLLQGSAPFMAMATALWDFRSDFMGIVQHVGSVLQSMIEDEGLPPIAIASYLGVWYVKVKLRSDAPHPAMKILSNIVQLAAAYFPQMKENTSRRLWAVFMVLVEFEHGDRMDEKKERDAIELMAEQCASLDVEVSDCPAQTFTERFAKGLTTGTANADIFAKASVIAKIKLSKAERK
jgi:tetratricopeptide (TPR) repeat protein